MVGWELGLSRQVLKGGVRGGVGEPSGWLASSRSPEGLTNGREVGL